MKAGCYRRRVGLVEHLPRSCHDPSVGVELTGLGRVEQSIVRRGVAQQERKLGGDLVAVQRLTVVLQLGAVHEMWRLQHRFDHELRPIGEIVATAKRRGAERKQRLIALQLVGCHRSAVRAPPERADERRRITHAVEAPERLSVVRYPFGELLRRPLIVQTEIRRDEQGSLVVREDALWRIAGEAVRETRHGIEAQQVSHALLPLLMCEADELREDRAAIERQVRSGNAGGLAGGDGLASRCCCRGAHAP